MSKSKGSRRSFIQEDCLADAKPLVLSEFEDYGVAALELVLCKAAEMDRRQSYRERLVDAVRLYVRCDRVPYVVMELNKRILEAADVKRREDAMLKVTDPDWIPRGMEVTRD